MKKSVFFAFVIALALPFCVFGVDTRPPETEAEPANTAEKVVVIDPGHGGLEWGVSVNMLTEKNITLDIAKLLAKKINSSLLGVKAVLTREGDDTISEEQRAGLANSMKADLYISIHCDYMPQTAISGIALYYSDSAYFVPQNDNGLLRWDDAQGRHGAASRQSAHTISKYLSSALILEKDALTQTGGNEKDVLPIPVRGVFSAPLHTLNGVNTQAVVIEIGNLNNPVDAGYLRDEKVIDSLAYHIKEGIINRLGAAK